VAGSVETRPECASAYPAAVDELPDEAASAEALLPQVYDELRALAGAFMARERGGHTLEPTALVHEAWLRVLKQTGVAWREPGHLRAVAAQAMRRVLVDHARARRAAKRDGGGERVTLHSQLVAAGEREVDVLDLEAALERLAERDARQARIVEMHVFGGMTQAEVAEVLGVSLTTVEDHWRIARAWLNRELSRGAGDH